MDINRIKQKIINEIPEVATTLDIKEYGGIIIRFKGNQKEGPNEIKYDFGDYSEEEEIIIRAIEDIRKNLMK